MAGLYTGGQITVVRAMIYNMWMLATFDEAKERLKRAKPDITKKQVQIDQKHALVF